MRIVVTGALGGVGRIVVEHLDDLGHEVVASDLAPSAQVLRESYIAADLTDAGQAFGTVRAADAVVHLAAIPAPDRDPDHIVFSNNIESAYNVFQAAAAGGIRRIVNLSSETVYGFGFPRHRAIPERLPIDESHPCSPSDPYGLSKLLAESALDAAVLASGVTAVSLRSAWVHGDADYLDATTERGRAVRRHAGLWSFIDRRDLARAVELALEAEVAGHTKCNVAAPENVAAAPLAELAAERFGPGVDVDPTGAPDAAGLDSRLAARVLGFETEYRFSHEIERVMRTTTTQSSAEESVREKKEHR